METRIKRRTIRIRSARDMIHNIENNLAELKKEHKQLDLLIYINETGIKKCAESGSPRL